jgi:DNA replicative helicase MCM subunit Mcm2 (Cdc46/Mcm family)
MPSRLEAELRGNLVHTVRAGARVSITGIVKTMQVRQVTDAVNLSDQSLSTYLTL